MRRFLFILIINFIYCQDFTVDGNLRIEGNVIYSDNSSQSTAFFSGINGVAEFENNSTWTVPSGIRKIRIQAVGGGQGGGSNGMYGSSPCGTNGKGGSAGGYIHAVIDVIPGEVLIISIGEGGLGTDIANTNGAFGGNTSINNEAGSILINAEGGGSDISGSIIIGSGFIRNGEIINGSNRTAGEPSSPNFGDDFGYGGVGTECISNAVPWFPGNGKPGYLLINW